MQVFLELCRLRFSAGREPNYVDSDCVLRAHLAFACRPFVVKLEVQHEAVGQSLLGQFGLGVQITALANGMLISQVFPGRTLAGADLATFPITLEINFRAVALYKWHLYL